jgi:hypothetical protein
VDYFPLSWVPMYGFHDAKPSISVGLGNLEMRERGLLAQRANGERLYVSADMLNIPKANFRRLYAQRAFNNGPPQHDRERAKLSAFNRWWYETLVGPDPALNPNYTGALLESVNRTLSLSPDEPRRIVRLESHLDFATFTRQQLDSGDLRHPKVVRHVAVITPDGSMVKAGDETRVLTRNGRAVPSAGVDAVE